MEARFSEFWYKFNRSETYEYLHIKVPAGFLMGISIGYGYYKLVLAGSFDEDEVVIHNIVFWVFLLLAGFSCAASLQIRCVAALCLPTLLGKTGRTLIHIVITAWVISGPVSNILHHSGEALASMTCVIKLHASQLQTFFYLIHSPLTSGYTNLAESVDIMNKSKNDIQFILNKMESDVWLASNLDGEVEDGNSFSSMMREKGITDCKKVFQAAVDECVQFLRRKHQQCLDTIGIWFLRDILCLLLKADFVCGAANFLNSHCYEIPTVDNHQLDKSYKRLQSLRKEIDDEYDINLTWEVLEEEPQEDVMDVDEITARLEKISTLYTRIFQLLIAVMKKLVTLSCVLILFKATSYNTKYLTYISHDNTFISSYFYRKDLERKSANKRFLIPFRKIEKRNLTTTFAPRLMALERRSVIFKMVKLFSEIFFVILIFSFDYAIYVIFTLTRKYSESSSNISGMHKLEGNGTIARMLQKLFQPFEDNTHFTNTTFSNLNCLPIPNALPPSVRNYVITGYCLLFFSMFVDVYAMRTRHLIAGFFYRKREKERIIYLYGEVLRERIHFVHFVNRTVKNLAKNYRLQQKHSLLRATADRFPKLKTKLNSLGFIRDACIVCDAPKSTEVQIIYCLNKTCGMTFCSTCWSEIGEKCWACSSIDP